MVSAEPALESVCSHSTIAGNLSAEVSTSFFQKDSSSMSSIKRDVKKKGSASTGVEICFSRPSPLSIGFAAGVLPFDFHKFLCYWWQLHRVERATSQCG